MLSAHSFLPPLKTSTSSSIRTALSKEELAMTQKVWKDQIRGGLLKTEMELDNLLFTLKIPRQPLTNCVIQKHFRPNMGFHEVTVLLEECKTVHLRYLQRVGGKPVDDDLLECFVAVGGHDDAGGEVDVVALRKIVKDFKLGIDFDSLIAEMDTDGDSSVDFFEFVDLLRGENDLNLNEGLTPNSTPPSSLAQSRTSSRGNSLALSTTHYLGAEEWSQLAKSRHPITSATPLPSPRAGMSLPRVERELKKRRITRRGASSVRK